MINFLIVDDSPTMRAMLSNLIYSMGGKVIGAAKTGEEAIEMAAKIRPDIITLDIEMPGKNGLQILPQLQKVSDAVIIMCSHFTSQAAPITLECLEKGAMDYILKAEIGKKLTAEIFKEQMQNAYIYLQNKRIPFTHQTVSTKYFNELKLLPLPKMIAIGISTGGPSALQNLFSELPTMPVPIVIIQHMSAAYLPAFAERLSQSTKHKVLIAQNHAPLLPGEVYLAPGGSHLLIQKHEQEEGAHQLFFHLSEEPKSAHYCPSVDVLFQSAAETLRHELLAILMTGMGRDGVEGAKTVRARGGVVFAQNESSCVVYGMPKAVIDLRLAHYEFSLQEIPLALSKFVLRS
ncbi:MAG: chemotaxis-specific protein-glutamate methyltransferase CheB [Silvanigrellaceae bacterium]|nr:chemotaxis-specific protein-glutamate methyltransferase CheB [Silvanigrellaceae bacterium]